MTEDELVKIWQSSPNQEVVKFEKSRLILEVQSKLESINRAVKIRDRNETIACIAVMPLFSLAAYFIPFLLSKIACILIVLWSIYVLMRLNKAKENKPSALTESYRDYLIKSRAFIQAQRQMLNTVLWWYILPCMICLTLFLIGFMNIPEKIPKLLKMEAGFVIVGLVIYYLNKKAVKTMFDPQLEKIDELIRIMEK